MKDILIAIVLGQLVFSPVYLALYAMRKADERDGEEQASIEAEKARQEAQRLTEGAKYHRILFGALRALQKAGTGGYHLTAAMRSEELDQELALAAVNLARQDALRWANDSTPECARHWATIQDIYNRTEALIREEGD